MKKCPLDPKYYDIESFKLIKSECLHNHKTDIWYSEKHCTGVCSICHCTYMYGPRNSSNKMAIFLRPIIKAFFDRSYKEYDKRGMKE